MWQRRSRPSGAPPRPQPWDHGVPAHCRPCQGANCRQQRIQRLVCRPVHAEQRSWQSRPDCRGATAQRQRGMGPIHDWPWHRCDPARDSKRRCAVFRVGICRQLWSRGAACDWWRKWVYRHLGIPRVSGQCRHVDGAARPWALSLDTCDPRNTLHDHSKREHYRRAVKLMTRPALVTRSVLASTFWGSHWQRVNESQMGHGR